MLQQQRPSALITYAPSVHHTTTSWWLMKRLGTTPATRHILILSATLSHCQVAQVCKLGTHLLIALNFAFLSSSLWRRPRLPRSCAPLRQFDTRIRSHCAAVCGVMGRLLVTTTWLLAAGSRRLHLYRRGLCRPIRCVTLCVELHRLVYDVCLHQSRQWFILTSSG